MKVLLLHGGRSAEHDVSVVSAGFVREVLDTSGHETTMVLIGRDGEWKLDGDILSISAEGVPWKLFSDQGGITFDIVFPVLHGPMGEDGTLQGLCRMAGWPCAGADVMTSAMAMNKVTTKRMAGTCGLPVLPWVSFDEGSDPDMEAVSALGYPVFVKPARMGSSVGISRLDGPEGLGEAVDLAREHDGLVIVEKGIDRAREIEVALLAEEGRISSSIPGEIVPGLAWYDYEAKYDCPASELLIPAPIPLEMADRVRSMAETSFSMLSGSGFARADFLLDGSGNLFFNEINTIPGFTGISMFPKLWEASGVPVSEVLERIMGEALRRHSLLRDPEGGG